jgi:hypothetical protein
MHKTKDNQSFLQIATNTHDNTPTPTNKNIELTL